jgi:RNA polymerase sigma-70 factor (sigma-E family)
MAERGPTAEPSAQFSGRATQRFALSARLYQCEGEDRRVSRATDAAFHEFAEAAIPRLRRLARSACRDAHRADDLVQITLEKMYGAWPRIHAADDPHAYSRTVLVRALISEQRRPWWAREVAAAHSELDGPAPTDGTEQAEARLTVAAALATLPPRQRLAVVLRHLEELPVAEVARLMDCSEGTVKSTTSDGMRSLRRALTPIEERTWTS